MKTGTAIWIIFITLFLLFGCEPEEIGKHAKRVVNGYHGVLE